MADAIMSSTAAPTFFAGWNVTIGGEVRRLTDGGLVGNNPTQFALLEASELAFEARLHHQAQNYHQRQQQSQSRSRNPNLNLNQNQNQNGDDVSVVLSLGCGAAAAAAMGHGGGWNAGLLRGTLGSITAAGDVLAGIFNVRMHAPASSVFVSPMHFIPFLR